MEAIRATRYVRRVRGGSQSHILECDDGREYCTKFLGNPQHDRVLANEYLCTRLAKAIGISVPVAAIVEVDAEFIERNNVRFVVNERTYIPRAGLQFGSRLIKADDVYDYLPAQIPIQNLREFAGILAFDKFTCQADGRQAVFYKNKRQRAFRAAMIDFGYAMNCDWSWADSPLRGAAARLELYANITGWRDFEPWLSRIENLTRVQLDEAAAGLPTEWYGDCEKLDQLLSALMDRRAIVCDLITEFRRSTRNPFPNWHDIPSVHPPSFELAFA